LVNCLSPRIIKYDALVISMPNDATHDSLAEKKWLQALANGDQSAMGGIYELYGERIFRYTFRMLGNRSDAEDATAETFLRVLRRSSELRADGAFRTWIFRIARNLCIDRLRQHKLLELPPDAQYSGSEERSALRVTVQQALRDLPSEYREPLVLCDLEEMPAREAAEVLQISVPALKSRLYRGRRALRDKLGGTLEMKK
jgi:RNA polymerase sigma-70 factor (ECF subfamily)